MAKDENAGFEGGGNSQRIASSELRGILEKIGTELENQTKQFAFVSRLDFWIQYSLLAAVFVIIMTLLGSAWVGIFLVMIISAVLVGLRWLQAQTVLTAIDRIRDILK
jgi:hypothetical protein